ncbi:ATP-binding cassette domain-containing protein [Paramaledivibacter caminithermalis]|jgi:ABC-type multidrug transport system fused ATPase/permease subunit|uniref:ABC-type multidrug transport system, ATPase and permease component n=1 Tax=Paramaledivibacter caminithermalis (strain DSM 15212 / CIP 107654 / DViRD3) TaxID=1121301 RepID=A0A1M6Q7E3_PARC5|nr:ATP-binding cassette domain-containing protein [Paramaledivibacter caminithermalis]SHK16056.1 ABC-type multidrug transport system, ATPase and permease component [Paramaledivibacter caminithermalis DSM 15212]
MILIFKDKISKLLLLWVKPYVDKVLELKTLESSNLTKTLSIPEYYQIDSVQKRYDKTSSSTKNIPNFIKKIYATYSTGFINYSIVGLFVLFLNFITPIIFANLTNGFRLREYVGFSELLLYSSLLIGSQLLTVIQNTNQYKLRWQLIISIENFIRNLVFRKTLNSRYSSNETGEVLNIYSGHADWMRGLVWLVDGLLSIIGIVANIILLYCFLGISGVVGGTLLFSATPFLTKKYKKLNIIDSKIHKLNRRRLLVITEILNNVKEVKLLNLFEFSLSKIKRSRQLMSDEIRLRNVKQITIYFVRYTIVPFTTFISIWLSTWIDTSVDLAQVIASFLVFQILDKTINNLFTSIHNARKAYESLNSILNYINDTDKENNYICRSISHKGITLNNASFGNTGTGVLKNIDIQIEHGELVVITGDVGSGKSLFIQSLLGVIPLISGAAKINSSIDFITNKPWFLPQSIRKNIVLNNIFDPDEYEKAITLSELITDIKNLDHRDLTIMINNGMNLSGGQQCRVQLASAIYSDKNILLMDNVLSSLDPIVRKSIISNLICNYWSNKTRIIVSDDPILLSKANRIVEFKNGSVCFNGPPLKSDANPLSLITETNDDFVSDSSISKFEISCNNQRKTPKNCNSSSNDKKMISRTAILVNYIKSLMSLSMMILMVAMFFVSQIMQIFVKFFIAYSENLQIDLRIVSTIYLLSIISLILVNLYRFRIVFLGNIKAADKYHNDYAEKCLRQRFQFFTQENIDRSIAVMSSDMKVVDNYIGGYIISLFEMLLGMVCTSALIVISSPVMIPFIVAFAFYFKRIYSEVRVVTQYSSKCAQLNHEPCIATLKSVSEGKLIIGVKKIEDYLISIWADYIKNSVNSEYTKQIVNRYYVFQLNIVATILLMVFIILMYTFQNNASVIAIVLSYAITITNSFERLLRDIRHTEIGITSLERLTSLKETITEVCNKEFNSDINIHKGAIAIKNLTCSYDESIVLDKFSLNVKAGERVLIRGRTGSGKSTLFNCITKLIEFDGSIEIDGIDINTLPIRMLRQRVVTITQKPVIFTDSIRSNLDPYQLFSDKDIYQAINKVGLNERLGCNLDRVLSPEVLSSGELQLFCLARALLSNPIILLIDEGMTHLDERSQRRIYEVLEEYFGNKTIISISHIGTQSSFYNRFVDISIEENLNTT